VRLIYDNDQNQSYFGRVTGNVYAELTIIPGLKFRTSYGLDYDGTFERTLRKSYVSGFLADPSNLVNESQNYDGNLIWDNTLTYDWIHGKHSLHVLAGQESIDYVNQNFFGSRQGYALEDIKTTPTSTLVLPIPSMEVTAPHMRYSLFLEKLTMRTMIVTWPRLPYVVTDLPASARITSLVLFRQRLLDGASVKKIFSRTTKSYPI
jgi:hypothetical protein